MFREMCEFNGRPIRLLEIINGSLLISIGDVESTQQTSMVSSLVVCLL